jgi:hypothetical protein
MQTRHLKTLAGNLTTLASRFGCLKDLPKTATVASSRTYTARSAAVARNEHELEAAKERKRSSRYEAFRFLKDRVAEMFAEMQVQRRTPARGRHRAPRSGSRPSASVARRSTRRQQYLNISDKHYAYGGRPPGSAARCWCRNFEEPLPTCVRVVEPAHATAVDHLRRLAAHAGEPPRHGRGPISHGIAMEVGSHACSEQGLRVPAAAARAASTGAPSAHAPE